MESTFKRERTEQFSKSHRHIPRYRSTAQEIADYETEDQRRLSKWDELFRNGERTSETDSTHQTEMPVKTYLNRVCCLCGGFFVVTLFENGSYQGGVYWGKEPQFAMRKRPREGASPAVLEEIWRHSDESWECHDCVAD
jgi:hypothetical protein